MLWAHVRCRRFVNILVHYNAFSEVWACFRALTVCTETTGSPILVQGCCFQFSPQLIFFDMHSEQCSTLKTTFFLFFVFFCYFRQLEINRNKLRFLEVIVVFYKTHRSTDIYLYICCWSVFLLTHHDAMTCSCILLNFYTHKYQRAC